MFTFDLPLIKTFPSFSALKVIGEIAVPLQSRLILALFHSPFFNSIISPGFAILFAAFSSLMSFTFMVLAKEEKIKSIKTISNEIDFNMGRLIFCSS